MELMLAVVLVPVAPHALCDGVLMSPLFISYVSDCLSFIAVL